MTSVTGTNRGSLASTKPARSVPPNTWTLPVIVWPGVNMTNSRGGRSSGPPPVREPPPGAPQTSPPPGTAAPMPGPHVGLVLLFGIEPAERVGRRRASSSRASASTAAMNEISSWSTISSGSTRVVGIAVAPEQAGVLDPDVPARRVDQVRQPVEPVERDDPVEAQVRPDEFDGLTAPAWRPGRAPVRVRLPRSSRRDCMPRRAWPVGLGASAGRRAGRGRRGSSASAPLSLWSPLTPALGDAVGVERAVARGVPAAQAVSPTAMSARPRVRRCPRIPYLVSAETWTTIEVPSRRLSVSESLVLAVTSPATTVGWMTTVRAVKVLPETEPWIATFEPTVTSDLVPAATADLVLGRAGERDDLRLAVAPLERQRAAADGGHLAGDLRRRDLDGRDGVGAVVVALLREADASPTSRSATRHRPARPCGSWCRR